MTNPERERERAQLLYEGFYRCPHTNRVLAGSPGDDKVLCGCQRPNPVAPREAPGVHVKAYLKPATIDEYLRQRATDTL